jgi:DNA-binding NarL/FixJ family response regulator
MEVAVPHATTIDRPRESLRVALADDHPIMRSALRSAIDSAPDLRVVGEASDGEELVAMVPEVRPDVVLLDLHMPRSDGLATLPRLRHAHPTVVVIVISAFDDAEHVREAFRRGAARYVSKAINPRDLATVVRQAVEGDVHLAGPEAEPAEEPGPRPDVLTNREREILALVAQGLASGEIARRLWVTEHTVKFHLGRIYGKLGVANRTEAAAWAHRWGLAEAVAEGAAEVAGPEVEPA